MKKRATTLTEFQSRLRETGGYRTLEECRASKRAKVGAWTTFRYTMGVTHVFPSCALAEPLGKLTTERWAEFCFTAVRTPEKLGMNVIVEGFQDRIKYPGPVMYLANHMSTTETIVLPPILLAFGPFSYVAKASLAHLPFLEKAAEHMRMVPIGRKSPREDLINILKVGGERIAGGDSFLIYPQGTRADVFSRAHYSSIGAKLAERARVPIVPIAVDTRCQPMRTRGILKGIFKDFGPVDTARDIRISAGPLIHFSKAKEMHKKSFDWIAIKLEEWGIPTER